ncbi:hypothetical protein [Desulfobacula sp.]|uniref:hypothetical protein n=1 Tax=Desulfobacula sp. TaxID=2593537 RepID=UPI00263273A0|nr:hypothetical protein [Desulfobacula sp.]
MQDIHDIRPPVPVGLDPMIFKIVLMVMGGILFLSLVFFLVKKYLKKKHQPKGLKYLPAPLAPYAAALKQLKLLFQRELTDPRLFYFDLTAVLRHYMGGSFGVNAIEMTSQEFVRCVNTLDLGREIKQDMAVFHKRSDPFKYAGIMPEKDQVKKDLLLIETIIHQIEKDLTKKAESKEGDA